MTHLTGMPDYSTGRELILNASEGTLQIAVTENEKPLCFEEWHQTQKGAEILADALAEICRRLGFKANAFHRIACVTGPGSFTGIRLVLATAAALRRVSPAQLASLDYLQALATSAVIARGVLYSEQIFVLTHAKRNLVHFQKFISYGPQIPALASDEVQLISAADALKQIAAQPCLVCGSGLKRNAEIFDAPVTGAGPDGAPNAILLPELVNPSLQALCLLARHGDYFPKDLEPKYVRSCDALDNLEAEQLEQAEKILAREPKSQI